MVPITRRTFSALAAAPLAWAQIARAQEPVFSTGVEVVNLLATVRTKKGEIIRDLSQSDFSVVENGRPQKVSYFVRETDLPLTIGLLIDTSMSQVRVLPAERSASLRFLDQVLREKKDHIFISQFDISAQTRQPLTDSRADLGQALSYVDTPTRKQLQSDPWRGTVLYDAIVQASEDAMAKQKGRKAVIVLTDGNDFGSTATLAEAIEAAQKAETLVYAVLFSDEGGPGPGILQRIARETGGGYFEVTKKQPIDRVFELIEEDLRSQYSIGFVSDHPAAGAEFRKLQVTVSRPDAIIHTRDRYWAGPR